MSLLPNTDSFIEILSCFSCGAQNTKKKQHILVTNFMNFFLSTPLEQLIIALFLVVTVDDCTCS